MDRFQRGPNDCLSIRDGRLFLEDRGATELADTFGTPLYAISENRLRQNVREYREAFSRLWPEGRVDILPAVKANWIPALRKILTQEGAGCDVYSAGELHAALSSGADPEKISVNGGGKSPEHIENCIRAGVRITMDDTDEFDLVEAAAARVGKKARVRFRLKPDLPNLWKPTAFSLELVPIDLGVQAYKNGIPTEHVIPLGRRVLTSEHVELTGFHLHLGRHHAGADYWRGAMTRYARLMGELKEAWGGYEPREIDVGGGIPSLRDPFAGMWNRSETPLFAAFWAVAAGLRVLGERTRYRILSAAFAAFLKKEPNRKLRPPIQDYAEAITSALRRELLKNNIPVQGITLQIEPGRSLYGDAGIHLARVLKVKRQTRPIPWNWVLLDTTCFFLAGGVLEANLHDFVVADKAEAPPVMTADIVGRSCFADRILPEVRVPDVAPGDVLALLDTGAYQEVSASNFNALPRPATILVNGSEAEVIRRAESLADVFSRDVLPERFRDGEKHPLGEPGKW